MFLFHPIHFLKFLVKSQPPRSYEKRYVNETFVGSRAFSHISINVINHYRLRTGADAYFGRSISCVARDGLSECRVRGLPFLVPRI